MIVTYEQAVRLKKLGFRSKAFYYYKKDENGKVMKFLADHPMNLNLRKRLSAPSVAEALQWIRDEKKIPCAVNIYTNPDKGGLYYGVFRNMAINIIPLNTETTFPEAESTLLTTILRDIE